MRPPCRLARLLAALALTASGVSSVTGCGARADATDVGRDVGQLQSMLLGERFTAGRLAGQTAWSGCAVVDTAALVPRLRCAPPPAPGSRRFAAIGRASRVVLPRLRSDSSPAVLRAAALVDLRWRDTDAAGVDRAIAALERARSRAPDDARVLNDLAVAYLARAERDQQLRPLLQALDAVERARAAGDASPVALFNRALLLERLYLVETARGAWDAYVAAEHDPAWRREGAAHRERLARLAAGSPRTPQTARETGLAALGTWGRAVTLGDSLGARRDLDSARALGAELDAAGADRSVALAVRAIEAAQRTPSRVRTLAAAHAAFADGLALYGRAAYEDAARELGRAERAMREAGTPAARWAAVYRALALLNRGARDSADAVLRRALADATPAEPALVGKILWTLGLNQVRRGSYEAAARLYGDAQPYFARLGETENLGMLSSLRAEALNFAGQAAAGHDEALRGMHLLAPFRASSFMANHISVFGGYARADRVPLAALDVADELLAVARSSGRPQSVAWAYRERARTALAAGRAEVARADLTEAERWMARVPPGVSRDRLAAYVGLVRAQVALAGDPAAARDELEAVVRGYRAARDEINLPNALYQAALAARAVGDTARARAALAEAVAAIESRRALFPSAEVRASYYETTENVYDAMIELSLARGDASEAFELLERSRAAVWAGTARDAPIGVPALRTRLPAGVLVIEYALLRERVIVWAVSRSAWRSISLPVPRDSIAALVARFHAELGDPAATAARARLFDVLLRPVAPELTAARELVVVPDRDLSSVPFAALWDGRAGRYVVQAYPVRTLPSAGFVGAAGMARHGVGGSALVVGDPAADTLATRGAVALRGAAEEAAQVARLYARARLLVGAHADRRRVLALLPSSSIFHFAGHAVANSEQPELSYLALVAGGADDGLLRAREIGALRLSHLGMVVLSACNTLGARATHAGPIAGLAYSFLRAGVPAMLSSLWDVNDDATTPLLVAFHRRAAGGMGAAEALRAAQLEALESDRPETRAPRVWAAFVYSGP